MRVARRLPRCVVGQQRLRLSAVDGQTPAHEDAGVPALGYVLTYGDLQQALDRRLDQLAIPVLRGAVVSALEETGDHIAVRYDMDGVERQFDASAVILADGGANLGKVPSLMIEEKDYAQHALLGHQAIEVGGAAGGHGGGWVNTYPALASQPHFRPGMCIALAHGPIAVHAVDFATLVAGNNARRHTQCAHQQYKT